MKPWTRHKGHIGGRHRQDRRQAGISGRQAAIGNRQAGVCREKQQVSTKPLIQENLLLTIKKQKNMSLKIYLRQEMRTTAKNKGYYYAYADNDEPMGVDALAAHMAAHNCPYTKGVIKGVLADMVGCIRELALNGRPVKIDDLAIFSAQVENEGGWPTLQDVDLTLGQGNLKALRLSARATGDFTRAELAKVGEVEINREWKQKVQQARKEEGA